MTHDEILSLLIPWAAQHEAIEQAGDALSDLCGASPESVLGRSLWGTFDLYTETLEARIIGHASSGWLSYFRDECEMGSLPRPVHIEGHDDIALAGIEALAALFVVLTA